MDYTDLLDSYPELEKEVEDLAHHGQILVIRNSDGSPRVLFYNERQYNTVIDIEFKKMWEDLPVPDEADLPKALEQGTLA